MLRRRNALKAIHRSDRAALHRLHLKTLDDVWREVGKDLDGLDPLVQAGADRSRLIGSLMKSAAQDAEVKGASWPSRHFLDLALAAAALGLVALLVHAVLQAGSVGIALRDLRKDARVSAESLHGADPDRIADKKLTQDVPRGGYVRPGWLAPVTAFKDQELRGRYRMSLRIRAEDLRLLPTLPARATLAVSAAGPGAPKGFLLHDVPVLTAEKSGGEAVLDAAFSDADLQALLPLLPKAEVRVVRPLP